MYGRYQYILVHTSTYLFILYICLYLLHFAILVPCYGTKEYMQQLNIQRNSRLSRIAGYIALYHFVLTCRGVKDSKEITMECQRSLYEPEP